MYAGCGLGAVPTGSVMAAFGQSGNPAIAGGNPMQGPDVVRRLLDYLQRAMQGDDVPSVLGLDASLLNYTDGGPQEADARAQGYGPGVVDQAYRAAQVWVSSRPNLYNQQLGPGYSTATVTGPDVALTADQAMQQVQAQQQAEHQAQTASAAAVRDYLRNSLFGHGWTAAIADAELARLDGVFQGRWPDIEAVWAQVRPELKEFTGGFTPSGGPGPVIPGLDPTRPNRIIYPDGSVVSAPPGTTVMRPVPVPYGGSEVPEIADETNRVVQPPVQAGLGGLSGFLLLGAVVGGLMFAGKKKGRR